VVNLKPTVSVVIPLYNHEKYIEAALQSVWNQTVRPIEIIIIDDGSIDGSANKVRELCKDHPEVIFWSWPNQGAHYALNAGVLRATGDFVAILNSDDCYQADRIESCLAAVQADSTTDVVFTVTSFIDDQDRSITNPWYDHALAFYQRESDFVLALMNANFLVTTSNLFVKRSLFKSLGLFSALRYTHDLEFLLRLVLEKKKIFFLERSLMSYRLHAKNTISEDKSQEDLERAAAFAYFLYRQWRNEQAQDDLSGTLNRYVDILGQQGILEIVEEFLVLLESGGDADRLSITFSEFLSRLGVDWVSRTRSDSLLPCFVIAREVFARRCTRAIEDARVQADIQWMTKQRDAWEATAADRQLVIDRQLTQLQELQAAHASHTLELQKIQTVQATQLQELQTANAVQATQLQQLQTANAYQAAELKVRCLANADQERVIADLATRLQHFSGVISSLESQQAQRDDTIAAFIEERTQIFNSTSWRVTKPLRYIGLQWGIYSRGGLQKPAPQDEIQANNPSALGHLGATHQTLLVLHEFSRTGAPRAVLYLAKALLQLHGIGPVVLSPSDGPIREEFKSEGFITIVDPSFFETGKQSAQNIEFVSGFEQVIVTPLTAYPFVRQFKAVASQLIWWIHEDSQGFTYIRDNFAADLEELFLACDAVWLGSPICHEPASRYVEDAKLHLLLYGCEDITLPHHAHSSGRKIFTLAGSVEPRKGQDIFLSAIKQLSPEIRRQAIFRMIGSPYNDWSASFHKQLLEQSQLIPEIEILPNVSFLQLRELYAETDIVVSASRADPMPISVTQGLMFSKVCLCSSVIGHAHLLKDGVDSLIFANESVENLTEKITWLIQNQSKWAEIGAAGRVVFEKYFLMEKFILNLSDLVKIGMKPELV